MQGYKFMIVVVEDKIEEQDKALEAIKTALEEDGEEHWVDKDPSRRCLVLKKTVTMVRFASNLEDANELLDFLEKQGTGSAVGVMTDLMFPKQGGLKEEPSGLTVIVSCIRSGTPVVLCSDTYHHDVDYLQGVFPILGKAHPKGEVPVILDEKDWTLAFASLLKLMVKPE